ncbi:SDR family NAD(P)-dependent oxidoreductase [Paenisporosarcina cavernae]|uniref:SDR family NAD(P)-dependent oxidoreductase n=1 Tax=Paenisporosarcina cavernae TaxID=2320858 RepID=A0A385YUY9_9BACL|nr:SDR family NAD(P)-dependent oxidoreductase [Paenisporosarcina cavernae]AYC29508.1 SDR family NAD(P)-dependent oxidoreductase [Paenisporosarcina cavernae]
MVKSKNILITGATSGIGYELATKLAVNGWKVYAVGRNAAKLAELESKGIHPIQADLRHTEQMDEWFSTLPAIDVAILNAGVGTFALANETTDEQIQEMFEVNVTSLMKLSARLQQTMIYRGRGHLVFVASQAGKIATPKAAVYAATKHAVLGYANALRMELQPYGIPVTTINPGPIDTPFLDLADKNASYRTSLGKFLMQPSEVAEAIIASIHRPVREVNLPRYMPILTKAYDLSPSLIERLGRPFFTKK